MWVHGATSGGRFIAPPVVVRRTAALTLERPRAGRQVATVDDRARLAARCRVETLKYVTMTIAGHGNVTSQLLSDDSWHIADIVETLPQ